MEAFLKDLDKTLSSKFSKPKVPLQLKIIGSTALFLQTSLIRGTKDLDILEIESLPQKTRDTLVQFGGKNSSLSRKYGIYLDIIKFALPFLPPQPSFVPILPLNNELESLEVFALDPIDVIISKLKPFRAQDVDDISELAHLNLINHTRLIERFKLALDSWLLDARALDLNNYIENLHTVERDFLGTPETPIDLPEWLKE